MVASRARNRIVAVGCGAILALVVAVAVLFFRSCGETVAEIALTEEPREARFAVEAPRTIGFATSFELKSSQFKYREDLPRALDCEIEILREGQRVALLVCNPFDMLVWTTGKSGQILRSLSGKLNDCGVRLPQSGAYVVRARRVWRDAAHPVELTSQTLTVQLER
jgi:hypothetical protein